MDKNHTLDFDRKTYSGLNKNQTLILIKNYILHFDKKNVL